MSVSDALAAGFSRTTRRPGAIILDLLWKAIWLAITLGLLLLFFLWFYSESKSIQLQAPVNPLQSPLVLMALGRALWAAYASTIFWFALSFVILSASAWVLLEAYFRARILMAAQHFKIFLASAIAKLLLIGSVMVVLGLTVFAPYLGTPVHEWRSLWPDTVGPLVVSILLLKVLWFVVMLLDTLIRGDALELLGREPFSVAGVIATLTVFEGMIVASFVAGIVVLAMVMSGPAGALIIAVAIIGSLFLLCLVHSYLLLVRFSSIAVLGSSLG
jgi:hypothetical protein